MSVAVIGFLGVALLLFLIFMRVPIAVALAASGLLGYAALDGWSPALKMVGLVPYQLASAYSLSVIPLFILMGAVASRANMATELFQASNAVFSGIRGALANATIGACALFGAICGSSIATAATFSKVAIPEMRRHGYEPSFAAGCVASAGTLDVLIPPSVLIAIYAIVAEQSLPKLYAAAMIPGIVLAALYVIVVWSVAWMRPAWIPQGGGYAARAAAARGGRDVEARRAVLLRGGRHLSRLVFADRGRGRGGLHRHRDRLCHRRHGLARTSRRPARDGLHHRGDLLHRGGRLHLLALHRADAVPERAGAVGPVRRPGAVLDPAGDHRALRPARHVPRRSEHDPDHRSGHAAAGECASASMASGSGCSSP